MMGTRIVIGIGVLLVVGLAIVALQQNDDVQGDLTASPPPSPVAPTPSKDNVSKTVQEKIGHLKDVVAKNPADSRTAFELARLLQDGHSTQEAIQYYEIGLKADARDIGARIEYSLCLYQLGREEDALKQNRIVLRGDGVNAQALFNIGAIHANRGMSDSAMYYWNRLITAHPGDALAVKAKENIKQLVNEKVTM
jgi:tetratricopeptide (TPR) repeat protein